MTSKMKKFIKAHARFLKAQEELKRYIVLSSLFSLTILKTFVSCLAAPVHVYIHMIMN